MSTNTKQARTRGVDYQAPMPVPKEKRRRGRPSDFEPELIEEACRLIRQGLTDSEICEEIGVSVPTYYRWRANFPEFRKATNDAKEVQDDRVVDSLIRVANEGNVTAQIFWLKNRRPSEWRDRRETEIVIPVSDEEPAKLDSRVNALAALALFNEAAYDPTLDVAGPLLEMTANAEEQDDGEDRTTAYDSRRSRSPDERSIRPSFDPDFDDLDPGEV